MTPDLNRRVNAALAALDETKSDREAVLARLRRDDPEAAAEVEALLTQGSSGRGAELERAIGAVLREAPAAIGPYLVESEVGRGGMGVVYRVLDPDLGRTLAVKTLKEEASFYPEMRRRFLEEARLMGQLQHPGVPPVHALGTLPDGRPWFAMKLIRGRTLAAILRGRPSPEAGLAGLLDAFGHVCETLAAAHQQGVIHRDLKPANVMVGPFGEVQVMDWGLAKLLADAPPEPLGDLSTIRPVRPARPDSETRAAMGTPQYMPPEQARASPGVDRRSDVFGLGAILCEILTGLPPYAGQTWREVEAGDTTAALARLDACAADAELKALTRRCLTADQAARPPDAAAVLADLRAYQEGVRERLRRADMERQEAAVRAEEARKRRAVARRWAAAVAALVLILGAAAWWAVLERRAADEKRGLERERVAARLDEAVRRLGDGDADGAAQRLDLIRPALAEPHLAGLRDRASGADADLALVRRLAALAARQWAVEQQAAAELASHGSGSAAARIVFTVKERTAEGGRLLAAEYEAALAGRGLTPAPADADKVLASPVRAAITAGLGNWLLLDRRHAGLHALLDAIDPTRAPVRRLLTRPDGVQEASHAGPGGDPFTALVLGEVLPPGRAVETLEAAVRDAPGDRRLLAALVRGLLTSTPPRAADAVGYARAALALRPDDAGLNVLLAAALSQAGRHQDALAQARRAVRLDPEVTAHRQLALCYLRLGRREEESRVLARAVELAPGDGELRASLGIAQLLTRRTGRAIPSLEAAARLDPRTPSHLSNLGVAYIGARRPADAVRVLERAVRLAPSSATAHLNLGAAYAGVERFAESARLSLRAAELRPDDDDAWANLGHAYLRLGLPARAEAALKRAVGLNPGLMRALANLGVARMSLGRHADALDPLARAAALSPRSHEPLGNLGFALGKLGRPDDAIVALRQAVRNKDDYFEAFRSLGWCYLEVGRPGDAARVLTRADEIVRDDPEVAVPLALAFERAGQPARALRRAEAATRLRPSDPEPHHLLGRMYFRAHRWGEAVRVLARADELSRRDPETATLIGTAYAELGRHEASVRHLRRAVAADPRDTGALAVLGVSLMELRRPREAAAALERAVGLGSQHARAFRDLGLAYLRLGRPAEAARVLTRAVELGPGSATAHGRLGNAWMACRRPAPAADAFRRCLAINPAAPCHSDRLAALILAGRPAEAAAAALTLAALPRHLWEEARYNAACACARAGSGRDDGAALPPGERAALRLRAQGWLREELTRFEAMARSPLAARRREAVSRLREMLREDDFLLVRDDALAALPPDEAARWRGLWAKARHLSTTRR